MTITKKIIIVMLAGLAVGAVILGIGGRIAMRMVALAAGEKLRFSVGGTAEIILAGAGGGTLGGLLFLIVQRFVPQAGSRRGMKLGAALLAIAVVPLLLSLGGLVAPLQMIVATIVLFPALFLVYGIAVEAIVVRWLKKERFSTSSPK